MERLTDQNGWPAGWYPDHDKGRFRWWDGSGWTGQWRPELDTEEDRLEAPADLEERS